MARPQERSLKFASKAFLALMASMLILQLLLMGASAQPTNDLESKSQSTYNNNNNNNNLDSIISELIDDASHRLKKSKNGRHLKSSLRFGRRSDPLFAPSEWEEEQQKQQDNNNYFNQATGMS